MMEKEEKKKLAEMNKKGKENLCSDKGEEGEMEVDGAMEDKRTSRQRRTKAQ